VRSVYISEFEDNLSVEKQHFFFKFILVVGVIISMAISFRYLNEQQAQLAPLFHLLVYFLGVNGSIYLLYIYINMYRQTERLNEIKFEESEVTELLCSFKRSHIDSKVSNFHQVVNNCHSEQKSKHYAIYIRNLQKRSDKLRLDEQTNSLASTANLAKLHAMNTVRKKLANYPLLRLEELISTNIASLKARKKQMKEAWQKQYDQLSWWDKLSCDRQDTSEIDHSLTKLKLVGHQFKIKYAKDTKKLRSFYKRKVSLVSARIEIAHQKALKALNERRPCNIKTDQFLQYSMWGEAFGMSASLVNELYDSHQVYDVLRDINSNFEDMSDLDIWWDCLWMPNEQLAGLVNLTKGAYFEQMVADQYGGQLHEHFNTPDTDIIINGVEHQIKATNSVSYINSVDADIPIIATSEVAEITDAIDSGISNIDITENTIDALGGSAIDMGDVAFDGLLSLGFLSTLRGINHASTTYKTTEDAGTAIEEGLGVAIVGTAKGVVATSEMVYNAATSKPARFVGIGMLKATGKTLRWINKRITD